jgi:hypothetical protein
MFIYLLSGVLMTSFKEEIYTNYLTSNGAIHTMKNPDNPITSGNHHVTNATFYAIQEKLTGFSKADIELATQFIESTRDVSGVFNRAANKLSQDQSHDDLIALAVTSNILDLPYAKEIYDHGNQWRFPKLFGLIPIPTKWYMDNTEETPDFHPKHLHWRFGWVVAVYKKAAKKELNFWDRFWYNRYMANRDPNLTSTSGRILRWLTTRVMKDECPEAVKKFNTQIALDYQNDMSDVLGIYHGYEHPFSSMTKDVDLFNE